MALKNFRFFSIVPVKFCSQINHNYHLGTNIHQIRFHPKNFVSEICHNHLQPKSQSNHALAYLPPLWLLLFLFQLFPASLIYNNHFLSWSIKLLVFAKFCFLKYFYIVCLCLKPHLMVHFLFLRDVRFNIFDIKVNDVVCLNSDLLFSDFQ